MKADRRFANQSSSFWAYVRAISEAHGYSRRGSNMVSAVSIQQMHSALRALGRPTEVLGSVDAPTDFALLLFEYFAYRASVLNDTVSHLLMNATEASGAFDELRRSVGAVLDRDVVNQGKVVAREFNVGGEWIKVPMNKQKGDKRLLAFLTGMVNLTVASRLGGLPCDYDPRKIPVIDHEDTLYAALSRRMDGAFPSTVNPIALWEVKEYYHTTTFGSKISDAVYITSLDGYERLELEAATGINIDHVVMVDAYDTWWGKGKSYLCRLIDVLNMGQIDTILFGREVLTELPSMVDNWKSLYTARL